ncbi:MAG: hypothetical protein M3Z75_17925 [Actinomycetota bacterium]|nr:hypothetical protein [Actinomycetota bacterium]
MLLAGAFVLAALVLCAAAVLAVFGITHFVMSGSEAIERDGIYPGLPASAWSLADSSGSIVRSPPGKPMQMIVFTDHSLKSFPSAADGLRDLAREAVDLEIVVLLRNRSRMAEPVLGLLGLGGIPVVTGSPSLYGRYNVRVTPFVIFVDSAGRVRASSLVNHAWQIERLWRLANIPLSAGTVPAASRFRRRLSRAEV